MANASKRKGSKFEADLVKDLNKNTYGTFKRIAGSGALGTVLNEPILTGDINGTFPGFPKRLKIECKVGYGGKEQFTLKKEWLNKIIEEANANWAFPLLIGKFSGARKVDGVQKFVVIDIDSFYYLMNFIHDLSERE